MLRFRCIQGDQKLHCVDEHRYFVWSQGSWMPHLELLPWTLRYVQTSKNQWVHTACPLLHGPKVAPDDFISNLLPSSDGIELPPSHWLLSTGSLAGWCKAVYSGWRGRWVKEKMGPGQWGPPMAPHISNCLPSSGEVRNKVNWPGVRGDWDTHNTRDLPLL